MNIVDTPFAPPPNGQYSQGVAAAGLIFVSAQLPIIPGSEAGLPAGIGAQTRQALANVAAILRAGGGGLDHLLSCMVFVTDIQNWPRVDAAFRGALGDHRPARAVVVSPELHMGALVAVQAIGSSTT